MNEDCKVNTDERAVNFYGRLTPRVGEDVIVAISPSNCHDADGSLIDVHGVLLVELLEFQRKLGSIELQELSVKRKGVSNAGKLKGLHVGHKFAARVLAVDTKPDGVIYIDLSKRAASDTLSIRAVEQRYSKADLLNKLLIACADEYGLDGHRIIEKVAWPRYTAHTHALDSLLHLIDTTQGKDHTALFALQRACGDNDLGELILDALKEVDICDLDSGSRYSRKAVGADSFEDDVRDLIEDGMSKMGDFEKEDVLRTIRVQLIDLAQTTHHTTNDCACTILSVILAHTLNNSFNPQSQQQHPPQSPISLPYTPPHNPSSSPIPSSKPILLEFKQLMKYWGSVIKQLLDTRRAQVVNGGKTVCCGQFDVITTLCEFCSQEHVRDVPNLFRDLLFLIYHDKHAIDLIDEEAILIWARRTKETCDDQDEQTQQRLVELDPLVAWLKQGVLNG